MPSSTPLSRRTLLKGLGVALALPLLETMSWAETPGKTTKSPVRLAFFYTPYGYGRGDGSFWPKEAKAFSPTGALPPTLEPLRPVVNDCLLLGGMSNPRADRANGVAGHVNEAAGWLTCAAMSMDKEKRSTVNIGISADQVAAQQLGVYTSLPSLELAVSNCNLSGTSEQGLSAAYVNTISYRSATQALPSDNSPRSVFNRLFSTRKSTAKKRGGGPTADASKFAGGGTVEAEGPSLDQSMLDLVMESTGALRKHVSGADQRTLDEYLDGVRALEKRVVAIEHQQAEAAKAQASKGKPRVGKFSDPIEVTVPSATVPRSEHLRVMADLMILAFQTDLTRVVTMPFAHAYDGSTYPELGFNDDYHACSHMDNAPESQKLLKIEQWNIKQFAYIVQRMRSLNDGNGTLLDNSILLLGSGMKDNSHNTYDNLPTLLAGRGGGTITPGRYIQAKGNMGDLLSAILARAGCTLEKPFANGTKLLPDLS